MTYRSLFALALTLAAFVCLAGLASGADPIPLATDTPPVIKITPDAPKAAPAPKAKSCPCSLCECKDGKGCSCYPPSACKCPNCPGLNAPKPIGNPPGPDFEWRSLPGIGFGWVQRGITAEAFAASRNVGSSRPQPTYQPAPLYYPFGIPGTCPTCRPGR